MLGTDPLGGGPELYFDGWPGHYAAVTGQIYGDVKYDDPVGPVFGVTNFTLLTLDVRQNQPNYPTIVNLDFWSEDEVIESTSLHFICYSSATDSFSFPPSTPT